MKTSSLFLLLSTILFQGCTGPDAMKSREKFKSELFAVEEDFSAMAQSEGIAKAFVFFAADSAVLLRKNKLVKGKASIQSQYASLPAGVTLKWKADFADVAASGDLGYTYGKFTYTSTDSLGKITRNEGIFHTVWKRQPDGKWRFVWD